MLLLKVDFPIFLIFFLKQVNLSMYVVEMGKWKDEDENLSLKKTKPRRYDSQLLLKSIITASFSLTHFMIKINIF